MAEKRTIEVEIKSNSQNLKQQLREAQKEVEKLSEKFGATSQEAINAAKKAAELKDAIGAAKDLTDAFNPDAKFNALSNSIGGVLNGFQAFEGVMGLVGVESSKVEEALLKVQSAMALSQGIQGLLEAKDAFIALKAVIASTAVGQKVLTAVTWVQVTAQKALNFVMKQNPVMLIVAGVIALTGAIYGIIKAIDIFSEKTEDATKVNERLTKSIEKQDEANEKKNKKLARNHAHEMAMLEAKGATEKQLHDLKMSQIDKEIKANEHQQKSELKNIKNLYANYKQAIKEDDSEKAKEIGKQIKDREKLYQELNGQHQDYINEKQELNAKYLSEEQKAEEAAAKERRDKANEKAKADLEKLKDFQKEARAVIDASLRDERENELAAVNEKYKERFILAKKYGKDTTDLTIALNTELNAIETKYAFEANELKKARDKEELERIAEENNKRIELEENQYKAQENARKRQIEIIQGELDLLEKKKDFTRAERDIKDSKQRELDRLKMSEDFIELSKTYDAELELARGSTQAEADVLKTFELEKDAIKKRYADAELERIKIEREARIEAINENLNYSTQALNAIQGLGDIIFSSKMKKLEKGSAEEEKMARKQFKFNKALMLGMAIIDSAKAVTASLAQSPIAIGPVPNPAGIASLATAVSSSALSIAKIAAMQFESASSGSASAPSGGGASGGGGQAPNFNIVGNSTANQLAQVEQKPVQAFVVSGEVTSAQALDRNRQVNATFG